MEYQKIFNSLSEASYSRFGTRNWNLANDQANANCSVRIKVVGNTEVLKSNLCDFNYAYILVRGNITVVGPPVTQVAFKTSAPLCVTKNNKN